MWLKCITSADRHKTPSAQPSDHSTSRTHVSPLCTHAEFHRLTLASASAGSADESTPASSSAEPLPIDVLRLVHAQLVNAEAARTAGECVKEFEAFNHLGLYFEQSGMLPLAAYHYNRCLSIAEAIEWLEGCMASNLALGLGAQLPVPGIV